jgi:transcriptional regulator with XRE-family HTH domain
MKNDGYTKTYIREWRQKRGLSLRQLAERLEYEPGGNPLISYASLSRIEKGKQPYSQPILEAIAHALNVRVVQLLEDHPEYEAEIIDLFRKIPDAKKDSALAILKALSEK